MNNVENKCKSVYTTSQEALIKAEFRRKEGQCYLDHAGATLYSEKQITGVMQDLANNLYANPHSKSSSSKITQDSVDVIRLLCLEHFKTNVDEYTVIFTSGATAALKLVAESFDYKNGCFTYLEDNHTSVLGMRQYAPNVKVVLNRDVSSLFNNDQKQVKSFGNSLFVYPAQCNFSGTKYPLSWIQKTKDGALNKLFPSKNWYCMLDAAAFVSTNQLDLSKYKPDFVCISFYKIFGYPTGLGALLVKNTSSDVLVKSYYGGGTVLISMSTKNIAIPRNILHERLEDGTISYLSIISLKHGFDTLQRLKLSMEIISQHTFLLAKYTYVSLVSLRHNNSQPVAVMYHDSNFESIEEQGGILNFNLLRPNGEYIGYAEVSHIANLFGIHLRTGCFCNPGSCQRHLMLSPKDVLEHFDRGHVCGDQNDLIDGVPTGSVRVSFGYMSTKNEVDEFLSMIEDCFVAKPSVRKFIPISNRDLNSIPTSHSGKTFNTIDSNSKRNPVEYKENKMEVLDNKISISNFAFTTTKKCFGSLESIYLYPIKSCALFEVGQWALVPSGLKYDREWMIANSTGICLTQKSNIDLCKIIPNLCSKLKTLQISYNGDFSECIPLYIEKNPLSEVFTCQSKVCGDPITAWDCGKAVSIWLSEALALPGLKLLKQCSEVTKARRKLQAGESVQLSLSNQAQFLLINRASIEWLHNRISKDDFTDSIDDLIKRFRPNFVVNFNEPFIENDIKEIHINNLIFKNVGNCTRCQMICINQFTGERTVEPLRTLSKEFGGKIAFGIYLMHDYSKENVLISVNSNAVGFC